MNIKDWVFIFGILCAFTIGMQTYGDWFKMIIVITALLYLYIKRDFIVCGNSIVTVKVFKDKKK